MLDEGIEAWYGVVKASASSKTTIIRRNISHSSAAPISFLVKFWPLVNKGAWLRLT